jgi:hypothetical protein
MIAGSTVNRRRSQKPQKEFRYVRKERNLITHLKSDLAKGHGLFPCFGVEKKQFRCPGCHSLGNFSSLLPCLFPVVNKKADPLRPCSRLRIGLRGFLLKGWGLNARLENQCVWKQCRNTPPETLSFHMKDSLLCIDLFSLARMRSPVRIRSSAPETLQKCRAFPVSPKCPACVQ